MIKYLLPTTLIVLIISAIFFIGSEYGYRKALINCQQKEITQINDSSDTLVKSVERRKVNAIKPIDDVWNELFAKYCSDCS